MHTSAQMNKLNQCSQRPRNPNGASPTRGRDSHEFQIVNQRILTLPEALFANPRRGQITHLLYGGAYKHKPYRWKCKILCSPPFTEFDGLKGMVIDPNSFPTSCPSLSSLAS